MSIRIGEKFYARKQVLPSSWTRPWSVFWHPQHVTRYSVSLLVITVSDKVTFLLFFGSSVPPQFRQRILFKLAMIVFKCLNGIAPSYLADDYVLAPGLGRRHLRFADTIKLLVRRTRTVIDARDFAWSAAAIWSSLPTVLRLSSCRFGHWRRNWKLSTRARRWSASEDHLFCALQMHWLLLLLLLLLLKEN